MRWFLAALVAVLLGWGTFLLSPYLALVDMARAVETGDGPRLAARVNTLALRNAFARQVANEAVLPSSQAIGPADRQLAAAALTAAASPLLDRYLTPDGLAGLVRAPFFQSRLVTARADEAAPPGGAGGNGSPAGLGRVVRSLTTLLGASHWRGFRNVYFGLPPDRPAAERARFQMRLSRFKWRLVAIELSAADRDRIADTVLGR